ncbi:MAG: hypothetical protein DRJ42_09825 [Deltaproteobacteria bacterium]|nr:MAG: hypothetical protein DRJ42_09825 [Deltaproteobacteria bacterium]
MTRERIHSFTGVFPLSAYLLLHVYETSSAASGRAAFIDGLHGRVLALEVLLVLLPLVVHALLGLSLWARPSSPPSSPDPAAALRPYQSAAFRTIQRVTGVVVLAFLILHLGHTLALGAAGLGPGAIYDRLRADLGTPLYLGTYVTGIAAMSVHLGTGLPAAVRRFGFAASDTAFLRARMIAGAVALIVFAVSINSLGHFAVGASFFGAAPGGTP